MANFKRQTTEPPIRLPTLVYRKNEEALIKAWPRLLREHRHKWVASTGDGQKLIVAPNMRELLDRLSEEERHGAVVRYVEETEHALL